MGDYTDWVQRQMDACDPASNTYAADLAAAYRAARAAIAADIAALEDSEVRLKPR